MNFRDLAQKTHIIVSVPFAFIILLQIIWVVSAGLSITKIGIIIFLLQALTYFASIFWSPLKLLEERQYLKFFARLTVIIILYILLRAIIITKEYFTDEFWGVLFSIVQIIYASQQLFLVIGMSIFVGVYELNAINARKREAALISSYEAISDKRRLESIIYQMQLNPHLIFNTLNAIKIESNALLPHISRAAELLATIQRIYLRNIVTGQMIRLDEELIAISSYVELESYLRGKNIHVKFLKDIGDNDLLIPPGLLLTLIENVFRYGIVHEQHFPALIKLYLNDGAIFLHTNNLKRTAIIKGHGLGQKNVKALLEHYYPGRHSFLISETEDHYNLKLQISL